MSTFAVVFAPGHLSAERAPSARAVTAAVLAPTPDTASTPAASTARDAREWRLLAAVLVALATATLAGPLRLRRHEPPAPDIAAPLDFAHPRRGPPALAV